MWEKRLKLFPEKSSLPTCNSQCPSKSPDLVGAGSGGAGFYHNKTNIVLPYSEPEILVLLNGVRSKSSVEEVHRRRGDAS